MQIHTATTDTEIAACYPVFRHLRPQYADTPADLARFIAQVQRQRATHGYKIVYTFADTNTTAVAACAGFRIAEFLAWGKSLYLDDLTTAPELRGHGHASALLDWLIAEARAQNCDHFHLDSGHQRHDAHRLYLNKGLKITSHHFALKLK